MFNILPWILGMTGYWIQLNTFYTFDFLRQQATISIFAAQNWFSVFGAAQRVLFLSHTHDILLHNKDFTWAGQPGVLTAAILVTYFCISYFNFFICIGLTGGQSANLNLYTYTYCAPITILCSLEKLFTVCPNWKCTLYKMYCWWRKCTEHTWDLISEKCIICIKYAWWFIVRDSSFFSNLIWILA